MKVNQYEVKVTVTEGDKRVNKIIYFVSSCLTNLAKELEKRMASDEKMIVNYINFLSTETEFVG